MLPKAPGGFYSEEVYNSVRDTIEAKISPVQLFLASCGPVGCASWRIVRDVVCGWADGGAINEDGSVSSQFIDGSNVGAAVEKMVGFGTAGDREVALRAHT